MNFFKNLKRYLYANLIWLGRVWVLWGVVLPLVLLLLIVFLPWNLANLVRYSGLALELLGIVTVAVGLKGKRELFNKPSFIEHIGNWWKQRPAWRLKVVSGIGASRSGGGTSSARGSAWYEPVDATLESRLEAAEKNLLSLRSQLQTFEQDTNAKYTKLEKVIESERQTRESSVQEIRTRLEDLAARDLSFEALGIYWLFCGLVFSSLSNEISDLLVFLK
ncbi:MAG: hypothetical protein ABL880_06285 [Methylotenera sp.]